MYIINLVTGGLDLNADCSFYLCSDHSFPSSLRFFGFINCVDYVNWSPLRDSKTFESLRRSGGKESGEKVLCRSISPRTLVLQREPADRLATASTKRCTKINNRLYHSNEANIRKVETPSLIDLTLITLAHILKYSKNLNAQQT